ncbi:hypothetical protein T02_10019 [Trichinella nativa]|uniref:Uncharacterized protein n=1 Tax=Trichinella nativa TaxID=6335 RepID=A0A0V1L0K6_9BILA|nr:hypothetical protein T02_10019 [Trichinella nativa]
MNTGKLRGKNSGYNSESNEWSKKAASNAPAARHELATASARPPPRSPPPEASTLADSWATPSAILSATWSSMTIFEMRSNSRSNEPTVTNASSVLSTHVCNANVCNCHGHSAAWRRFKRNQSCPRLAVVVLPSIPKYWRSRAISASWLSVLFNLSDSDILEVSSTSTAVLTTVTPPQPATTKLLYNDPTPAGSKMYKGRNHQRESAQKFVQQRHLELCIRVPVHRSRWRWLDDEQFQRVFISQRIHHSQRCWQLSHALVVFDTAVKRFRDNPLQPLFIENHTFQRLGQFFQNFLLAQLNANKQTRLLMAAEEKIHLFTEQLCNLIRHENYANTAQQIRAGRFDIE